MGSLGSRDAERYEGSKPSMQSTTVGRFGSAYVLEWRVMEAMIGGASGHAECKRDVLLMDGEGILVRERR